MKNSSDCTALTPNRSGFDKRLKPFIGDLGIILPTVETVGYRHDDSFGDLRIILPMVETVGYRYNENNYRFGKRK